MENFRLKDVIRVLIVDDDEDDYILTKSILNRIKPQNYHVDWSPDEKGALNSIGDYDVYLIDYRLGANTGIDLIRKFIQAGCKDPIILLTGQGDLEVDLQAMKSGAADYLIKSEINEQILERSIRYSILRYYSQYLFEEERLKYSNLFKQSIDAIYTANENFEFLDANPALHKLINIDNEGLRNSRFKDLFISERTYNLFVATLTAERRIVDFEALLRTTNEKTLNCLLSAVYLTDEETGECKGIQGVIHDTTERKNAEKQLKRQDKLAMTGRLARSIAHEVRNPLTNVNLAVDQLKTEIPENALTTTYIDIIERNSERINQLITDLLNSTKLRELTLETCSISGFVETLIDLNKDRLNLLGHKLICNVSPNLPLVKIDEAKLTIAISNIIVNAIEAMEKDKGVLEVNVDRAGDYLTISISDNGPGISRENLEKLFEPFFTGKKTGMGLGLTTTSSIISAHGGFIEVESELNDGATFIIILPTL